MDIAGRNAFILGNARSLVASIEVILIRNQPSKPQEAQFHEHNWKTFSASWWYSKVTPMINNEDGITEDGMKLYIFHVKFINILHINAINYPCHVLGLNLMSRLMRFILNILWTTFGILFIIHPYLHSSRETTKRISCVF